MIHCYDYFWSAWTSASPLTITVRTFQGKTSTQTVAATPVPGIYVVGPAQVTFASYITSTDAIHHGPFQGLFIREREAAQSADGNVWFRWEEDQPVIGVAPTSYSAGVF